MLKQFYLIVITFISYIYVYKTKQKEFLFQWQLVNYVIKGHKSQNYESLLVTQCVEKKYEGVIVPF